MDARAKQRLVGIDVADPRDPALIEQDGRDRSPTASGLQEQVLGGEVGAERLDAESSARASA